MSGEAGRTPCGNRVSGDHTPDGVASNELPKQAIEKTRVPKKTMITIK